MGDVNSLGCITEMRKCAFLSLWVCVCFLNVCLKYSYIEMN